MDQKQNFSMWYFLSVMVVMLALQSILYNRHVESLAYSDFKTLLRAGKITEVLIADDRLTGTADLRGAATLLPPEVAKNLPRDDLDKHPFVSARVPDPNLVAELQAGKVRFSGQVEIKWVSNLISWVAPAFIFLAIWGLFMRRMGGGLLMAA